LGLAGCQDNVTTPFPEGLEPLEDNIAGDPSGEELVTESKDTDHIHVYGRGLVFSDPAMLWSLAKQPPAMFARCSTDEQTVVMENNEPAYEASWLVHYIVRDILTVEWDDQWRYGVVEGTADAPELGMIRHQKTQGSDFIRLSRGTVQIIATDDPNITELAFVEHLDAVSGSTGDVKRGMQDNYNRLKALAHGEAQPACP
jgi:hypothetical protein